MDMDIKYSIEDEEGSLIEFNVAMKKGTSIIDELRILLVADGQKIHISDQIKIMFDKLKDQGIENIKSLLIEDGITTIAPSSFAKIDIKIDQVCWPASCTVIPDHCFYDSNIESITGTDFVTTIGEGAFQCSRLKTFKWPPLCREIPPSCFSLSSLEDITGIDNTTEIGDFAFEYSRIKMFHWPIACNKIPINCFYKTPLEKITGMKKVDAIGRSAFGRTKIKSINWPQKCKTIPEDCFCSSSLKKITGIDEVEAIEDSAFASTSLQTFFWPPKCDTIPEKCFYHTPLESVVGLEGVKEIMSEAFYKTKLTSFILYPNCTKIKDDTFCYTEIRELKVIGKGGIINFDMSFFKCWTMNQFEKLEKIDMSDCAGVITSNKDEFIYKQIKNKLIVPYYGVF